MTNFRVISALTAVLLLTSCALRAQQGTLRGERVIVTNQDASVYPPNDVIIRTSGLNNRVLMGIGVSDDAIIQLYNDSNNKMIEISTIESYNMLSLRTDPGVEKVASGIVVGGTALDMGALQILGEDRASGLDAYTSIQGGDMTSNTLLVRTTNVGPGHVQWDDTSGTGGLVTVHGYNGSGTSYSLYWPRLSWSASSCGSNCIIQISASTGQMTFVPNSSLPVVDTTSLVYGSSDSTKQVRLEVDGLSPFATRVLTVQNSNYTLAGTDISNTFTATQTLQNINFSLDNTYSIGSINAPSTIFSHNSILGKIGSYTGSFQMINTSGASFSVVPDTSSRMSVNPGIITPILTLTSSLIVPGGPGITTTLVCGTGQALKGVIISLGVITSIVCGTP